MEIILLVMSPIRQVLPQGLAVFFVAAALATTHSTADRRFVTGAIRAAISTVAEFAWLSPQVNDPGQVKKM